MDSMSVVAFGASAESIINKRVSLKVKAADCVGIYGVCFVAKAISRVTNDRLGQLNAVSFREARFSGPIRSERHILGEGTSLCCFVTGSSPRCI